MLTFSSDGPTADEQMRAVIFSVKELFTEAVAEGRRRYVHVLSPSPKREYELIVVGDLPVQNRLPAIQLARGEQILPGPSGDRAPEGLISRQGR